MHRILRDLAKIGVGLFIADLFSVVWMGNAGFFPLTALGVTWTADALLPIVLFDLGVIVLLIHWGWHLKMPVRSPSERTLLYIVGALFLLVSIAHLLRLALGLEVELGDFMVPLWLSWVGVVVTLYLSYSSFHFALRSK